MIIHQTYQLKTKSTSKATSQRKKTKERLLNHTQERFLGTKLEMGTKGKFETSYKSP